MLPEFEAINAMESMRPTDPRQDLLEVYRCIAGEPAGGEHFHVGHADLGGRPSARHPIRPARPLTQSLAALLPPHLAALAGQEPS